jgi:hypothetical protein
LVSSTNATVDEVKYSIFRTGSGGFSGTLPMSRGVGPASSTGLARAASSSLAFAYAPLDSTPYHSVPRRVLECAATVQQPGQNAAERSRKRGAPRAPKMAQISRILR